MFQICYKFFLFLKCNDINKKIFFIPLPIFFFYTVLASLQMISFVACVRVHWFFILFFHKKYCMYTSVMGNSTINMVLFPWIHFENGSEQKMKLGKKTVSCECTSSMISSCVLVSVNYTYVVWHSLLIEYFTCMREWSMVWTSGCIDKNFPHEINLFLNLLPCLLYYMLAFSLLALQDTWKN